jgi:L-amino acid N-acyltransferase
MIAIFSAPSSSQARWSSESPILTTISAVRTRFVEPEDAQALMAIYNLEIVETTTTFDVIPRELDEQLEWIEDHRGTYPAIVAVDDDATDGLRGARGDIIAGFAALGQFRVRAAYATTVENSIYVERSARGRGVGRLLLTDLIEIAQHAGFHSIIARIVGENDASIALHQACGFEIVGTEREVGRKHGKWLDVVELQRLLDA